MNVETAPLHLDPSELKDRLRKLRGQFGELRRRL